YGLTTALASIPFEVEAFTELTRLPILYSPTHYVVAGAAAVIAAGIAGYMPARRAARLNPVDIIRGAA
ncbi:MAG: ABC transporter permease, partial [Alphaproteobacteria bacterium]|nr:ABC transporter permease [Alphaproteobacteria bacterium]